MKESWSDLVPNYAAVIMPLIQILPSIDVPGDQWSGVGWGIFACLACLGCSTASKLHFHTEK